MQNIPYSSIVGSLIYASTRTRSDIIFAIGMFGWYQSNLGLGH